MNAIEDIRTKVPGDVLDYQQLVSLLPGYAKPRDKIGALLARGDLVRVRKGLYVFGERCRRGPLDRVLLANLIYGPSYVSLEYALSHHGLIPERVENVTSVTTGRPRRFVTPFGTFTYRPLPPARYSPGAGWTGDADARHLIATPEKAMVDTVWADKRLRVASRRGVQAYLLEDLRVDVARLASLDMDRLARIAAAFASRKIDLLLRAVSAWRERPHE